MITLLFSATPRIRCAVPYSRHSPTFVAADWCCTDGRRGSSVCHSQLVHICPYQDHFPGMMPPVAASKSKVLLVSNLCRGGGSASACLSSVLGGKCRLTGPNGLSPMPPSSTASIPASPQTSLGRSPLSKSIPCPLHSSACLCSVRYHSCKATGKGETGF